MIDDPFVYEAWSKVDIIIYRELIEVFKPRVGAVGGSGTVLTLTEDIVFVKGEDADP